MSSPADDLPAAAGAHALRDRLAALGVAADVAADGALAVVRVAPPRGGAAWLAGVRRAEIVSAARHAGFTHVALELLPPDAPADHEGPGADVRRAEPAP